MSYPKNWRLLRAAAGLGVLSAFAVAATGAQAADTPLSIELTAGSLSNTAPVITPFGATLTGLAQTVHTTVGSWSVTDATGSNDGYSVTVSASDPEVEGVAGDAGTGGSITLTPTTASAAPGNSAGTGPQAATAQSLGTVAASIQNAAAGTGQGDWDFAADSGLVESLAVVIPGDASVGTYTSTLTFTTAAPVV
jgi:hypothetical protein